MLGLKTIDKLVARLQLGYITETSPSKLLNLLQRDIDTVSDLSLVLVEKEVPFQKSRFLEGPDTEIKYQIIADLQYKDILIYDAVPFHFQFRSPEELNINMTLGDRLKTLYAIGTTFQSKGITVYFERDRKPFSEFVATYEDQIAKLDFLINNYHPNQS